jgi:hypothetical protein
MTQSPFMGLRIYFAPYIRRHATHNVWNLPLAWIETRSLSLPVLTSLHLCIREISSDKAHFLNGKREMSGDISRVPVDPHQMSGDICRMPADTRQMSGDIPRVQRHLRNVWRHMWCACRHPANVWRHIWCACRHPASVALYQYILGPA